MWLGVFLSLTGSIAVAPQAAPELWRLTKHDAHQGRRLLARFLPFLRKSVDVRAATISANVSMMAVAVTATGKVTHNGPVDEQLEQLWQEIDLVRGDLGKLRTDTEERAKAIERTVAALDQRERTQHEDLLRRLQEAEEQQTEFNARALPLIGFGIVLSAAASWLAERSFWVNVVVWVLMVAIGVRVVGPIVTRGWRRRQDERRATSTESS